MKKKIRVGILFGGQSAEHEVSLQSAKNVVEALDKNKYEPVLIGIDKSGKWYLQQESGFLLNANNPKLISLNKTDTSVTLMPWSSEHNIQTVEGESSPGGIDVVFPVLHGPLGEDGTVQGLLKLAHLPFVGAGVLGSAVGMDKDVMKRLLKEAEIPVARFVVCTRRSDNTVISNEMRNPSQGDLLSKTRDDNDVTYEKVVGKLGVPFFVKPANLGSSVGVSKVRTEDAFAKAIKDAFSYDNKILIEEFIKGRELECAVLGNDSPKASVAGEVIPHREFYSYEAKYIDEDGAGLEIPANVSPEIMKKLREMAVRAFTILCCEGMARVDFFLTEDGKIYVNEINTIPGFTKISMYPKLWEASGVGYTDLIDRLIQFAIERFEKEKRLKTIKE